MFNSDDILRQILAVIEPTATQKEAAAKSQNCLRGNVGQYFTASILSGSYSRDTAIAPIEDVDIIFYLSPSSEYWRSPLEAVLGLYPPTETTLQKLASIIRQSYSQSDIRTQNRSVQLNMNHLSIDAVPAFAVDSELIKIPDSSTRQWITSAPKRHARIATEVNNRQNLLFKPLVKLVKFWNSKLPQSAQLKSFTIETVLVRLFQTTQLPNLQEGMLRFFDFVCFLGGKSLYYPWNNNCEIYLNWLIQSIPDAAITGSNTAQGTSWEVFLKFIGACEQSRDQILDLRKMITKTQFNDKLLSVFRLQN